MVVIFDDARKGMEGQITRDRWAIDLGFEMQSA
jgi:hypothetical protein